MATVLNLPVDQGSDITYQFQALDVNGNPFDLTGAAIALVAKVSETAPLAALELSTAGGQVDISQGDQGIWTVTFPAAVTALVPAMALVYQQQANLPNGETYRLSQGVVSVSGQITAQAATAPFVGTVPGSPKTAAGNGINQVTVQVGGGGGSYVLPPASNNTLGGVLVPDGGSLAVDETGNLTIPAGVFVPVVDYANTSLKAVTFEGSGSLGDIQNANNAQAIGFGTYAGYAFDGLVNNDSSGVFQFVGLGNLTTHNQTVPLIYRGSQGAGQAGLVVTDGDVQVLNAQGTASASVLTYGYANASFVRTTGLNYLNNQTTNCTLSFSDTSTDSRLQWQKAANANATGSQWNEWLDNTGRYGVIQWILKPDLTGYNWVWGGTTLNANSTAAVLPETVLQVNYSRNFAAGEAYGRGIGISPVDIYLKENYLGGPALPAKQWTANSLLTQSYADTRYVNEPANGTFTGTFLSQDGKTVTVQNGVIVSVQ